jgi:regulator of replication initiation timing
LEETNFDATIEIKEEPISDDEDIVQRNQLTLSDVPDLVNNDTGKRKTILISTSDNSNDSLQNQNSRARKSFPNTILPQALQIRNSHTMVCIPKVFSPSSSSFANQGSASSTTTTTSTIVQDQPLSSENVSNGSISNNSNSEKSVINGVHETNDANSENAIVGINEANRRDLPRLVPRPSGVFTSEGNSFQRESGAISALFSENAHRMTDYFKSLLVDTIGAISSGVPIAENVLLKLEIEKLKEQLKTLKTENQLKLEKIRKDHADELKSLKTSYGEIKISLFFFI